MKINRHKNDRKNIKKRVDHVKLRLAGKQISRLSVILDSLLFLILSQKSVAHSTLAYFIG